MTVRAELVAAIEAAVLPDFPGVQVYGAPEDVTQLPAIVLVPDDEWATPATYGGTAQVIKWACQVSIAAPRADVDSAIDLIESLRPLIVEGLNTLGGKWSSLSKPDTIELAGIQALASFMAIELMTGRQT